jgi:spore germination protein
VIQETEKSMIIQGIALFKGDRMVVRIKPEDKVVLGLLRDHVQTGELYMDLSERKGSGDQTTLSYISSRRNVRVEPPGANREGSPWKATVAISIKGSLLEYIGDRSVSDVADQSELEAEMADWVRQKCESLIRIMQQSKTDSIGIGQHARNTIPYAEWSRLDWSEAFAKADIRVQVDVHSKIRASDSRAGWKYPGRLVLLFPR